MAGTERGMPGEPRDRGQTGLWFARLNLRSEQDGNCPCANNRSVQAVPFLLPYFPTFYLHVSQPEIVEVSVFAFPLEGETPACKG